MVVERGSEALKECNDLQSRQPRANPNPQHEPSISVEALSASGPPERAVSDADLSRDLAQRALAHYLPFAKHGAEIRCFIHSISLWAAAASKSAACLLLRCNFHLPVISLDEFPGELDDV